MARRRPTSASRPYPRTARLNELLREIVAEGMADLDDDRLQHTTITGVSVDRDLNRAEVFFDSLNLADDDEAQEALTELRPKLQGYISRGARLRKTPELRFTPDPAVRAGVQIDALLRDLPAAEPVDGNPDAYRPPRIVEDDEDDDDDGAEPTDA